MGPNLSPLVKLCDVQMLFFVIVMAIAEITTGTRLMDIFFLIILRVFPIYCLFLLNHR
jgi:hypothetical protein